MPVLGYWDFRGYCEPIRLLLVYKGVPFEDKRYDLKKMDAWTIDKANTLGLDFPNLPYYLDGDVKLTQSSTILRYLGEKYDMDGKTEKDKLRVSLAEQQAVDLRYALIHFVLCKDIERGKTDFLKTTAKELKKWETFVGKRRFIAGDYVTYADFILYDTLDFYRLFEQNVFKDFPWLKAFRDRIHNLPELQTYLKGPTYKRWPVFGLVCKWGGSGPEPKHI